uniref:Trc8 protein n=1 Tax=Fopius arisanus TaxID=64838 RepID=A0A0C9RPK6_9HYME
METIMRDRIMGFANVVMRVPPLFIIDELLRMSLGVPEDNVILLSNETLNNFKVESMQNTLVGSLVSPEPFFMQQFNINDYFYQTYVNTLMKFLACCLGE